jgi:protein phosphatase
MNIKIPDLSLVVLIGASGSGKSTFARRHFLPTEVLSSDFCRGLVSDDENDQGATKEAFDILHFIAAKRLARRRLTVIDATNVEQAARRPLVGLAREYHVLPVAIVLRLPEQVCRERNQGRPDRTFGPHVVRRQVQELRKSVRSLEREGFRHVFILSTAEEIQAATLQRQPLWTDRRSVRGPFDIIGDLHGCCDELEELLPRLGYEISPAAEEGPLAWPIHRHPEGRQAVFLGDLVDRGPRVLDTLRLVRAMVREGAAWCLPGNHDVKLVRKLRGRNVQITHGLDRTLAELDALPEGDRDLVRQELISFLDGLVSHYVFDEGRLVVAHAGLREDLQGRASRVVREFALYGETTGESDEFGLPVRYDWAADYRGQARVVYGHTPVPEAEWLNHTLNIDTGAVFGGKLTALRYPEMDLISVPARAVYAAPARPFPPTPSSPLSSQQQQDDLLDIQDVSGKRLIGTRLYSSITIREENAAAALEVMSRFAVDPRWLIYLPPTMSPSETSRRPHLLEHPQEAFDYYRRRGVPRLICEEKHMGSRAVVIVARDAEAARGRFGVEDAGAGACFTRTGRRFFEAPGTEAVVLDQIRGAAEAANAWSELSTDWLCLDCEIMPWSAKAQALIARQYAPTAAAGESALTAALEHLTTAAEAGLPVEALRERCIARLGAVRLFADAFRRYSWPVRGPEDLRIAPFHLLASEGKAHIDRDHLWHLEILGRLSDAGTGLLQKTPYRVVDLTDAASEAEAIAWWEALTAAGGEGFVVKPLDFVGSDSRGLIQPAIKCRGPEYLRIVYGPEYTLPQHLERLRARGLGRKRGLALQEFALGVEALERFVRREPLRRVHECVFGVLALESQPVDPRL